jgi:multidrug resistance efflux pump
VSPIDTQLPAQRNRPRLSGAADVELPSDSSPPAEVRTVTAPTKRDRRRSRLRTLRGWLFVLLIVAGAAALAYRQIEQRLDRRDHVALGNVALTAQPVDVVSTSSASVVDVLVVPRQKVSAGQVVATVNSIQPGPSGGTQQVHQRLVAPVSGIVASVPTNAGAAVLPGAVIVRLYQPAQLSFLANLTLEKATKLQIGMTGRITSDVTGPVDVRVSSVEPSLTPGASGDLTAAVQLTPVNTAKIANLLPGLLFQGYVDDRTAK